MEGQEISAIVLAGGGSTRMGQNKALLKLGKKTMIERVVDSLRPVFKDIILVTNHPEDYPMMEGVEFVKDKKNHKRKNSLVGVYSGLLSIQNSRAFVVPCDMPFLNQGLIRHMIKQVGDEDILVPYTGGHYQPLHAIYATTCIKAMEEALGEQDYRLTAFLKRVNTRTIGDETINMFSSDLKCFLNINTYDSYLDIKDNWEC